MEVISKLEGTTVRRSLHRMVRSSWMPSLSDYFKIQYFCLAIRVHAGQDRFMKTMCGRQWLFIVTALALSGVQATADDANSGELIQARFDQLIPTSYPTIGARFDRLIQTTWPLTDPGIGRIPITENLVHPLDQPLVIVNEGWGQLPAIRPKRESIPELRQTSANRHAPARTSGKTR